MTTHSSAPRSSSAALSRRAVLAGAAAVGVTSALVACGQGSGSSGAGTADTSAGPTTVPVANVPVGGGTILTDKSLVVTQPSAGTFKAFSAVCTHQGCLVAEVANSKITCPCHNSQFSVADGSVLTGPATQGLAAKSVTVSGDTLTVS
jgi:Rieske Fe-S protein